jgi:DNA-binding MarR family transcriptional regulator
MKNNQYKQNLYEKEKRRLKRISRMKPEQKEKYTQNLLNRGQRRNKIKNQIMEILSSEENLAIVDIQRKLGLNRNTLNYWINRFEKEGWFKRKTIETQGEEARGQPKTLVLNKKKLKEARQYSYRHYKTFEEYNLKSIFAQKVLREIEEKQPSDKQHQRLIELFKQFGKESGGARLVFLLYDDYVKLNYRLSLTDKGKKALEKIKKKK